MTSVFAFRCAAYLHLGVFHYLTVLEMEVACNHDFQSLPSAAPRTSIWAFFIT
jgi:hypothetical protein